MPSRPATRIIPFRPVLPKPIRTPAPPRIIRAPARIAPPPRATRAVLGTGRDRKLTFTDAAGRCVPLIYGKVRCGARVVYGKTDSNGIFVYVVYLFSEGEVNSISNIRIDDRSPEELGLILNTTYKVYTGTAAQGVDSIISGFDPLWVSGHPGDAYMTAKFDMRHALAGHTNLEAIEATIEGVKVRDPRSDGTLVSRFYRNDVALAIADFLTDNRYGVAWPDARLKWSGSWTESANDCDGTIASQPSAPASAPTVSTVVDATEADYSPLTHTYVYNWVYTYFVNGVESPPSPASTNYTHDQNTGFKRVTVTLTNGPGGTTAKKIYRRHSSGAYNLETVINDNTTTAYVVRVGDWQLTESNPPPTQVVKRYEIGIWLGEQAPLDDVLDTFRAHCAGFLTFDGQYDFWIDKARSASSLTFDETNIIGEPEIETMGLAKMFSKVTVEFTDRDAGFQNSRAAVEHPYLALPPNENEREEKREGNFRLFGVPTYDQAMRLAKLHFNRSRLTKVVSFLTNAKGVRALPGLVILVTHSAGPLSSTPIVVTDIVPVNGGEMYRVRGEFYDAAIYSDTLQVNPGPIIPGVANPFQTPTNPTGVTLSEVVTDNSDGTAGSRIKISWTNADTQWYRATRVTVNDGLNTVELGDFRDGPVYFENPRFNVLYTITLRTVTVTHQISSGVSATITPSLGGDFIAPPGRAYDPADGTTYWDEPPFLIPGPQYGTSFWTNVNFPSYDGTKVNDGNFTNAAFTLNTTLESTLSLDLGSGNSKAFRGIRVSTDTAFAYPSEKANLGVLYSDDGTGWLNVGTSGVWTKGATPDNKHFVQTWAASEGTHRYWRLRRNTVTASAVNVVEVQFFELGTGPEIRIDHYDVWNTFPLVPQLLKSVPATSRPTAAMPFNLMEFVVPNNNSINIGVAAVMASGATSAWYDSQITAPAASSSGYVRMQTSSTVEQPGYIDVSGNAKAGSFTADVGDFITTANLTGSPANVANKVDLGTRSMSSVPSGTQNLNRRAITLSGSGQLGYATSNPGKLIELSLTGDTQYSHLVDINHTNTGTIGDSIGLYVTTDADTGDTAAGLAVINKGKADGVYIGARGRATGTVGALGIGIDVNRAADSNNEQNGAAPSTGILITNWTSSANLGTCIQANNFVATNLSPLFVGQCNGATLVGTAATSGGNANAGLILFDNTSTPRFEAHYNGQIVGTRVNITAPDGSTIAETVKAGAATPTVALVEWQNSSAAAQSKIDKKGSLQTLASSRIAPWVEARVACTAATNISSVSLTDITGATVTFTPPSDCRCLIVATYNLTQTAGTTGSAHGFYGALTVNGTAEGPLAYVTFSALNEVKMATQVWAVALTGGTSYTIKLQGQNDSASDTYQIFDTSTGFAFAGVGKF